MGERRNLTAAVISAADVGAENTARVIPTHATVVTVGHAVVGYVVDKRNARRHLTPTQLQAATRIRAAARLLRWRADQGEAPTTGAVEAALDVLADAARFISSGRFSPANLRDHLPTEWRPMVTGSQVLRAIEMPRDPRAGMMGNRAAGRTLNVHLVEVTSLEAEDDGKPFPLTPIDETEQALALRRATRRRRMEAARKRRSRQAKRSAEYCSSRVRISYHLRGDADAACNIPASSQAGAIRAAVGGGAAKVADIVRATGFPATTVRPIISRLVKAGAIQRTGRGRYAPAVPLAQADEAGRDAPAVTVHSGPETPPSPQEPPFETRHDATTPAPVADIERAPHARETVRAGRPHTPAGRDGVIHLAPSTALHPRRPMFSRLPGTIFPFNFRRIDNAAPRCP